MTADGNTFLQQTLMHKTRSTEFLQLRCWVHNNIRTRFLLLWQ